MDFKFLQVNPDTLVPNPWNSNVVSPDNDTKLEESIKRLGMFKPVIVRELADGTLQLIGGEHRAQVAKRLGYTTIPVINLGQIDDDKAKKVGIVDNSRFGEDDSYKLNELIATLQNADELVDFTPFSEADLNSIFIGSSIALDDLEAMSLPTDDIELPEKAKQTHQVMRFKVPLQDVETITQLIEKTIKVQGFEDSDSLTNAGDALVHLLLKD